MDMIPRNDYGERCQFDAYCKLVLYHEAIDYLREMQRRRDRERKPVGRPTPQYKANGYIPVCAEPYGRCAMTSFQVRRTGPL